MVYESAEDIYTGKAIVSETSGSGSEHVLTQQQHSDRKNSLFRPFRRLSDAFKKHPAQTPSPKLTRAISGDFTNSIRAAWVSAPQQRWTRRRSNSISTLEHLGSFSNMSLTSASAKSSCDYDATAIPRRNSVSLKPALVDTKAIAEKLDKNQEPQGTTSGHKPSRKMAVSQHPSRAFRKLSEELSSKQILPSKGGPIKAFSPQMAKIKSSISKERTSLIPPSTQCGHKNFKLPFGARNGTQPRGRSTSLTDPRKLNINFLDEEGTSPAEIRPHARSLPNTSSVFFACGRSQNELEFVELNKNLDSGTLKASARILDEDGMTLLHKAAQNGFTVLAKFLVKNGVSTEIVDSQGWSPLCVALDNEHLECAELLVMLGANVNFASSDGKTILHRMASHGNYKAVEFLISCRVDLDVEDTHGWPALHYAFKRKKLKCAALLMSSGANIARYTEKRVQEFSMVSEIVNISQWKYDLHAE